MLNIHTLLANKLRDKRKVDANRYLEILKQLGNSDTIPDETADELSSLTTSLGISHRQVDRDIKLLQLHKDNKELGNTAKGKYDSATRSWKIYNDYNAETDRLFAERKLHAEQLHIAHRKDQENAGYARDADNKARMIESYFPYLLTPETWVDILDKNHPLIAGYDLDGTPRTTPTHDKGGNALKNTNRPSVMQYDATVLKL